MLQKRIIPALLLRDRALVKTVKFDKYGYIGDPINTVRIFNELEVDELIFLDILASRLNTKPDFKILKEIADECFMPLSYGGGIRNLEDMKTIFGIGFEKIAINTHAMENPGFITDAADKFGNQSIIGSIDIKKNLLGKYDVFVIDGTKKIKKNPVEWAVELEKLGAGELLITSIDRDGTWNGYDTEIIHKITSNVNIPVIANGGAGKVEHIYEVIKSGGASAVALGSMVVYQAKDMGVLVNFPDTKELMEALSL
jgi:cyclase